MSIIQAVILGIVQGLTEFIPVSSSGHLLLLHDVFGTTENTLVFDVALHVGTLLALLLYFRHDLLQLLTNIASKNKQGRTAWLLVAATIPAATLGLIFSGTIEDNLRTPAVGATMLAAVGVLMIIVDRKQQTSQPNQEVTQKQGLLIGCAQAAALIPGVSRSGATMTMGIFAGLSRVQAARFSFLLAIPIIAGSALGILLKNSADVTATGNWQLFIGVGASFVSGMLAIRFLLKVVAEWGLKYFGYYRIALAAAVFIFLV